MEDNAVMRGREEDDILLTEQSRRGRGRPRKEEQRYDYPFRFNGTEEHVYMRRVLEEELGMNGGEVMRYCLEMVFNMKIGWKN